MTTESQTETGNEQSAYDNALDIVSNIPDWQTLPFINEAVYRLMMIDAYEPLARKCDGGHNYMDDERYAEQCGVTPGNRNAETQSLLRLLENFRSRVATLTHQRDKHAPRNQSTGKGESAAGDSPRCSRPSS